MDEKQLRKYLQAASTYLAERIREEMSRRAYDRTYADTHGQLDPDDDAADPYLMAGGLGDTELLAVGVFAQLLEIADQSPQGQTLPPVSDVPELANTSTENMTDAEHAAFLAKLRWLAIAKAHEWWPTYCESQKAIHTAERGADGLIRLYRDGQLVFTGSHLAEELAGMPVAVATIPHTAQDVTPRPPPQLPLAEQPRPPAAPAPARQEPALPSVVDVGEPWQWRPWDG